MNNIEKCYVCDFETLSGKAAIELGKTYVWAWSCTPISTPDAEHTIVGNNIHEFFILLRHFGNSTIFFHNLKFDGKFISDYLFTHGYSYVESAIYEDSEGIGVKERKKLHPKEFSSMITEAGTVYCYKICFSAGRTCTILDSLKKLPFKVEKIAEAFNTSVKKLSIDYEAFRPEFYTLTDEEKEYVKNDTIVVAEALKTQFEAGLNRMTIGSDCLNCFVKEHLPKFRYYFPSLDFEEDSFVRSAYSGGWCYLHKPGVFYGGDSYDCNSLYPSVMHSKSGLAYPMGYGEKFKGEYVYDRHYPLYFQRFSVRKFNLREGKLPCVKLKKNKYIKSNVWVKEYDCDMYDEEPIVMTMAKPEFELFVENYDVYDIDFLDGYKYAAGKGFFDSYINKYFEEKKNASGAKRQIAKLMLNNLSGKFGTRVSQGDKNLVYDSSSETVKYCCSKPYFQRGLYIPVACFITAYARCFTIRAAEANIDRFIYADTDSIHLIGHDKPKGIEIDGKELLCWKLESSWDYGIFRRQKCYIEVPNDWKERFKKDSSCANDFIKCSGMPEDAKKIFMDSILSGERCIEDFDIGLSIPNGKLQSKTLPGGCVLVAGTYTLREEMSISF